LITAICNLAELPPPRLGLLVGDCLVNLMASLDYVIWELAKKYAARSLSPPPIGRDNPTFPLFFDRVRFNKCAEKLAKYNFPPGVVAEIASVQPFNSQNVATLGYEPLWLLFRMVNKDKHRLPLLVEAQIAEHTLLALGYTAAAGSGSLTIGTRTEPRESEGTPAVAAEAHLVSYISFDDPQIPSGPIEQMLGETVKCVATIIPRFDRYLC
jgi:hypothetical protein